MKNNGFVVSSLFSSVSALVKIITAFLLSKIIALILGPKGLGMIGQLSSFISVILVFAGGTINNGIVKYIAEYNNFEKEKITHIISTAFKIVLFSGISIGILLIVFSSQISNYVLQTTDYKNVIIIFGFTVLFYGLNNFLLSILNGYKNFEKFNKINIYGSILGLIISAFFIYELNIFGALVSLVTNQSIIFLLTLYMVRNEKWLNKENFSSPFNKEEGLKLSKFALLAIASTALVPTSQFFVRKYIISHLGYVEAGYWELVTRISTYSLLFFSLSISTYYLPRVSEIRLKKELRAEIINAYKLIIPAALLVFIIIYCARNLVIQILSTASFSKSGELFLFQFIGDFFKICSWVLGFQMVGRGMIKLSLFTEIFYNLLFVILSILFINYFGFVGISYGYALNYFIYLLLLLFIFRKLFFLKD
nr:O-antigen translocase [Chryseobacterium jejuense]